MTKAKYILLLLISILVFSPVFAGSFFSSSDLSDLRVIQIDKENGVAIIIDPSGNEATITTGDMISASDHKVVAIERAYIKVRLSNTITRMPVRADVLNKEGGRTLRAPSDE